MFLISPALDKYFQLRLTSRNYRSQTYRRALRKELRHSRFGRILLRNLNELMAKNTSWHEEFSALVTGKDYQEAFWESDLGFLWYHGNLHARNSYFELALSEIKEHQYVSVLDVGCGWGEFSARAASLPIVKRSLGIDISPEIIAKAIQSHANTSAQFEHRDFSGIEEHFDLITFFGSTDYITPDTFRPLLLHALKLADKKIIIVNSLRQVPFTHALDMKEAMQIKRYDSGYVQPLNYLLSEAKKNFSFEFTIEKAGLDSALAIITKK